MVSAPCPIPATRTARRSVVSRMAAPPSEMGQQWKSRSGSATSRLSITASSVTASWKWAKGLPLREAEAGGDQRAVVAFPGELLRVHRGDHERVGPLDTRVVHGGQGRLRDEVLEVLVPPAEAGHPRAGDPHVAHPSISNRGVTGCQRVCAGLAATVGGPPASARRPGIVPGGTRTSNSRIRRRRYARCRPSARAAP